MSNYGVTPTGVNVKRLDVLLEEFHKKVSEGWGVDTRLNPHSFFNVLFTAFFDAVAELWEFGEGDYHAMYPFSAEGISLDHAMEFGGVTREDDRKTYYPIYCECEDGITVAKNTIIKSDTNPELRFYASADTEVSRAAFNRVSVRVLTLEPNKIYTVAVDGILYNVTSTPESTPVSVLTAIAELIPPAELNATVDAGTLKIEVLDVKKPSNLVLSENLTTSSVTGIVLFASEDAGEIILPDGAINQIVTQITGLYAVANVGGYIAGRLRQTDPEARKSYADKIFLRSTRMTESIRSAILQNVQGAENVAVFENQYDYPDVYGRPPHSVEVVIDGGSDIAIAKQILDTKAGGIQTYGNVEVQVPGEYGESITIRFNRPQYLYVWFRVIVTMGATLPPDYADVIKQSIISQTEVLEPGAVLVPQKFIGDIYRKLPGIEYLQTPVFFTVDSAAQPTTYENVIIPITARQRAVTDATRIEVVLNGA
ncbi:hypothetical protein FACS1894208_07230 [Clostridia bacterium]|nr:hypothetical protein FACS1894208_07230 [Clostridia bacterium]